MLPFERKLEMVYECPPEIKNLAIFPAALVVAETLLLQEEKEVMSMLEGPGFASFKFI